MSVSTRRDQLGPVPPKNSPLGNRHWPLDTACWKAGIPFFSTPGGQARTGLLLGRDRPVPRAEISCDLLIPRVLRERAVKIDPIAIEIDIVLVRAPQPGKPVRVERMD
jgi:hypothetical protein